MKKNPEFEKFTGFMDKLAKVPHDELKAELDAEKQEKREPRRKQPPMSPVSSDRETANRLTEAANRIGEATAAGLRKLPDNPQVEY